MSNTTTTTTDTTVKKGLLRADGLILVQKRKTLIGDAGDYYYTLTFTNGVDIVTLTCGKSADTMKLMTKYNLGLDFINSKLKLQSFEVSA